jgi:hypothetical protein
MPLLANPESKAGSVILCLLLAAAAPVLRVEGADDTILPPTCLLLFLFLFLFF